MTVVPMIADQAPRRAEAIQVYDPVPQLDTARFEHMQRIATAMAQSSLVPESLVNRVSGQGSNRVLEPLPPQQAIANCFLIVNQAVRWNMDPFAVASCCSVVYGRLMYEGKLVHAVLQAKLGIHLVYEWNEETGDKFGIRIYPKEDPSRTIKGTVGEWKTSGPGSPWIKQPRLQLAYRGAREWTRLYEPAVLLGVYTEDELADLQSATRHVATRVEPPRSAPAIEHRPAETKAAPAQAQPAPATMPDLPAELDRRPKPAESAKAEEAKPKRERKPKAAPEPEEQKADDGPLAYTPEQIADIIDDWGGQIGAATSTTILGEIADQLTACDYPRETQRHLADLIQKRTAEIAEESKAQDQQDAQAEGIIRGDDPDFVRGQQDARAGISRCLNSAIRNDANRLAAWTAGYESAKGPK